MKDEIILAVFDYLETKQKGLDAMPNTMQIGNYNREKAKELLQEFAKYYHVPIKKTNKKPDLKQAFRAFIDNGKGYVETIPNLFNAL